MAIAFEFSLKRHATTAQNRIALRWHQLIRWSPPPATQPKDQQLDYFFFLPIHFQQIASRQSLWTGLPIWDFCEARGQGDAWEPCARSVSIWPIWWCPLLARGKLEPFPMQLTFFSWSSRLFSSARNFCKTLSYSQFLRRSESLNRIWIVWRPSSLPDSCCSECWVSRKFQKPKCLAGHLRLIKYPAPCTHFFRPKSSPCRAVPRFHRLSFCRNGFCL